MIGKEGGGGSYLIQVEYRNIDSPVYVPQLAAVK